MAFCQPVFVEGPVGELLRESFSLILSAVQENFKNIAKTHACMQSQINELKSDNYALIKILWQKSGASQGMVMNDPWRKSGVTHTPVEHASMTMSALMEHPLQRSGITRTPLDYAPSTMGSILQSTSGPTSLLQSGITQTHLEYASTTMGGISQKTSGPTSVLQAGITQMPLEYASTTMGAISQNTSGPTSVLEAGIMEYASTTMGSISQDISEATSVLQAGTTQTPLEYASTTMGCVSQNISGATSVLQSGITQTPLEYVSTTMGSISQDISGATSVLQSGITQMPVEYPATTMASISQSTSGPTSEVQHLAPAWSAAIRHAGEGDVRSTDLRTAAISTDEAAFYLQGSVRLHDGPVHAVCVCTNSMDGVQKERLGISGSSAVIASASWDATVKLSGVKLGDEVMTLGEADAPREQGMGGLYAVAFAPSCTGVLGCASKDHSVYVWTENLSRRLRLVGHFGEVNDVAFHPAEHVLCSVSDDGTAIAWDFQSGAGFRTLRGHDREVYGCTFLGREQPYSVATCCFDRKARVFDLRDHSVSALLEMHSEEVIGIDYSSDEWLLATGSDDGIIGIWDARKWRILQQINTRTSCLGENSDKRVKFSPDGKYIAAACSTGQALVYKVSSPLEGVGSAGMHSDCVFDVAWVDSSRSGGWEIVTASHDHTCQLWRQGSSEPDGQAQLRTTSPRSARPLPVGPPPQIKVRRRAKKGQSTIRASLSSTGDEC